MCSSDLILCGKMVELVEHPVICQLKKKELQTMSNMLILMGSVCLISYLTFLCLIFESFNLKVKVLITVTLKESNNVKKNYVLCFELEYCVFPQNLDLRGIFVMYLIAPKDL